MKNKKAASKKNAIPTTQRHLPFAEVKSDTVIMKDGTIRAILMVSSINFALKNEDEQNAIVSSYVSFLNSLDFPLQIVVQSRQLYIKPYLEKLLKQEREQTNELLRAQIADYRSFISELVSLGKIMSKQFFVVVPYDPLSNKTKGFWKRIGEVVNPAITVKLKEDRFQQRKHDLDMRIRQIIGPHQHEPRGRAPGHAVFDRTVLFNIQSGHRFQRTLGVRQSIAGGKIIEN